MEDMNLTPPVLSKMLSFNPSVAAGIPEDVMALRGRILDDN
jgi:hypothetical protein